MFIKFFRNNKYTNEFERLTEFVFIKHLHTEYYFVLISHIKKQFKDAKKVNTELKNTHINDDTEAGINRREGIEGELFESDILLSLSQIEIILKEISRNSKLIIIFC